MFGGVYQFVNKLYKDIIPSNMSQNSTIVFFIYLLNHNIKIKQQIQILEAVKLIPFAIRQTTAHLIANGINTMYTEDG